MPSPNNVLPRAALLAALALAALAPPAFALIDVKTPLSKIYNESQSIYVGTIADFNPDTQVLTIKPFTAYKGPAIDVESLRIKIKGPDSLRNEIHPGDPIAIFQGARNFLFHVADHWYVGQQPDKPGVFIITDRIGQTPAAPLDESFPGKTPALLKALDELKAGKSTLLDSIPEKLFPNPTKENFTLPKNATAFAAYQIEKFPGTIFVVATLNGIQGFHSTENNTLEKFPLKNIAQLHPAHITATTYDDAPALLIDSDLYTADAIGAAKDGNTFHKSAHLNLPNEKILALAIDDLSDDGQPTLAILTPKDLLRINLDSLITHEVSATMPTSAPAPAAPVIIDNAQRLTAKSLLSFHPEQKTTLGDSASLISIDLNNDHRPDLLILTPTGTLTLLNRGFGSFLVNKDQAAPLLDPANSKSPTLPLLASTPNTLYLLQKDGTLYRYNFPNK